jgi:glycerophosphoryl diester phosphodiesterase
MRPCFDRPIAHRGLHDRSAGVIENSFSAFEAAIAEGYAIECDVQLSGDGVPFIFHDDTLERLTEAAGPVGARSMAEISALALASGKDTPQPLSSFLDQIGGRVPLQIELKPQSTSHRSHRTVSATLEALQSYRGPTSLMSFDPALLLELRRQRAPFPLGILVQAYRSPTDRLSLGQHLVLRHLLHLPATQFSFVSCHYRALDLPIVRLLRSLGWPVTAWTVRSEDEAKAALASSDQIVFEGFLPPR